MRVKRRCPLTLAANAHPARPPIAFLGARINLRLESYVVKRVIKQHVHGTLFAEKGRATLFLADMEPSSESDRSIYLCLAYPLQGTEEPILPVLVLDDWGSEIRGLGLYEWIREFGEQFPRAELFGYDLQGKERQCFLRELELHGRMPCYAYRAKDLPVSQGVLIESVFLADISAPIPRRLPHPAPVGRPLRWARVSWWAVDEKAIASGTPPETLQPN